MYLPVAGRLAQISPAQNKRKLKILLTQIICIILNKDVFVERFLFFCVL